MKESVSWQVENQNGSIVLLYVQAMLCCIVFIAKQGYYTLPIYLSETSTENKKHENINLIYFACNRCHCIQ